MTVTELGRRHSGVLKNAGLKYNATEFECGDGTAYVDIDIWSALDDAPVDVSAVGWAFGVLSELAARVAGDADQKRVTAVNLSVGVQTA